MFSAAVTACGSGDDAPKPDARVSGACILEIDLKEEVTPEVLNQFLDAGSLQLCRWFDSSGSRAVLLDLRSGFDNVKCDPDQIRSPTISEISTSSEWRVVGGEGLGDLCDVGGKQISDTAWAELLLMPGSRGEFCFKVESENHLLNPMKDDDVLGYGSYLYTHYGLPIEYVRSESGVLFVMPFADGGPRIESMEQDVVRLLARMHVSVTPIVCGR